MTEACFTTFFWFTFNKIITCITFEYWVITGIVPSNDDVHSVWNQRLFSPTKGRRITQKFIGLVQVKQVLYIRYITDWNAYVKQITVFMELLMNEPLVSVREQFNSSISYTQCQTFQTHFNLCGAHVHKRKLCIDVVKTSGQKSVSTCTISAQKARPRTWCMLSSNWNILWFHCKRASKAYINVYSWLSPTPDFRFDVVVVVIVICASNHMFVYLNFTDTTGSKNVPPQALRWWAHAMWR